MTTPLWDAAYNAFTDAIASLDVEGVSAFFDAEWPLTTTNLSHIVLQVCRGIEDDQNSREETALQRDQIVATLLSNGRVETIDAKNLNEALIFAADGGWVNSTDILIHSSAIRMNMSILVEALESVAHYVPEATVYYPAGAELGHMGKPAHNIVYALLIDSIQGVLAQMKCDLEPAGFFPPRPDRLPPVGPPQ